MTLVIFCLLFSFVDYVPVKGEIIWHAAQFTIAKCWKQPKCPSANEWIQKLWYIFTMEFYAAERKKELIPTATAWMELESIMLSEKATFIDLTEAFDTINSNLARRKLHAVDLTSFVWRLFY